MAVTVGASVGVSVPSVIVAVEGGTVDVGGTACACLAQPTRMKMKAKREYLMFFKMSPQYAKIGFTQNSE